MGGKVNSAMVQSATSVRTMTRDARENLRLVRSGKSLLVIEDDLALVEFINAILDDQYSGVDWEYATSGEVALERIKRRALERPGRPFDLCLTDIFLEGETTGFDVWLECQEKYPAMPFVVTSYLTFDKYFSVLRGAKQCPLYLPKPLTVRGCKAVFEGYL